MASKRGIIYVMDMESSLSDALCRRVMDMGQYIIFRKWDMNINAEAEIETYKNEVRGLIISGSGKNINGKKAPPPEVPAAFLALNIPTLGICYGMQYMAHVMGVPIVRCWNETDPTKRSKKSAKSDPGEQGATLFERTAESAACPLFEGLGEKFPVWMKHNWMLGDIPEGWTHLGRTARCPVAAISSGNRYAVQFHPEPHNSLYGKVIFHNFITNICGLDTPYF